MPGEKLPEPEYKNESENVSETIKLIEQPTDSLKLTSTLLQPGQTIGNCFEVIEELGSGGMSIVYRVRHLLLNKDFALKLLRPDRSLNEDAFKRFKQEAKAASGLIHPNICRVTDFGIDSNLERPYLVMDLAEGDTLAQFIKERGKLSSEEALTIAIQVAEALSVAHKAGIVHRDLKPGNIMIQKQGETIKAMVVDFGIAKILEGENQEPDLTQTGEVFGTPNYMSPEQCRGQRLDARSDIYSFGCVLYEMLSGQVPFVATNSLEILMMHVGKDPKSIKGTGVSAGTEAVVLKCMEKDPQHRYLSMQDLIQDLNAAKEGSKTSARQQHAMFKAARAPLKTKLVASGILIGLLAIIFAVYTVTSRIGHQEAQQAAFLAAEQATQKAAEQQALIQTPAPSKRTETYKGKDLIAWTAEIEKDPQNPKLYYGRGMLHQLRDERTNAIDDYSEAIALDPNYVNAYLQRSDQYSMIADYAKAIADADKVISIAPNKTSGYETRAFAELDTEQYNKQIEDLRKALVLHRAAGAPKGSLAYMYNSLGDAYLNLGRFSEAKKCATEAINDTDDIALEHYAYCLRAVASCFQHDYEAANEDLSKITNSGDVTSWDLHFLALYQASLGDLNLAERTLQRAMEKETFPARAYRLRGEIFRAIGQYKRSFQEHSSATSLQQFPPGYRQRALASMALGQYVSASNDLQKSLKLNPKSSRTLSYLALVESKLGKQKEAALHMKQAFETDSQVPMVFVNRASWLLSQGFLDQALKDCDKALKQDPWLKEGYLTRAEIYQKSGKPDLAARDIEKAKTLLTHIEY